MPYREQNSNKGTYGKVLNVAGSENYIGAAYLSTLAALKTGAGYAALASCGKVTDSVSKMLPEAVFVSRQKALKNISDYTVLLIGCGLGINRDSEKVFKEFIKKSKDMPTVIDADGLNILAKKQTELPSQTIITPHPMEAARLLNKNLKEVLDDTQKSAKELSEKYNCVTVLKTHRTVITDGNNIFINQHGSSALAKAGTGDVLAGIISGLLAQKTELFEAAKLGVYLHSRAGELAAEKLTEYSVLASELVDFLPAAIREIL